MARSFRFRSVLAAVLVLPGVATAQAPSVSGFTPGTREIALVDFTGMKPGDQLPRNLRVLSGEPTIVLWEGVPMLRDYQLSNFILTLPEVLPRDFTLEFDLVPRSCLCLPPDLMFEGSGTRSRSATSAEVVWLKDLVTVVGGGAYKDFTVPGEIAEAMPNTVVQIRASFDGPAFRLYSNGALIVDEADRKFTRGRQLRFVLGGQGTDDDKSVFLARIRVATNSPPPAGIAAGARPTSGTTAASPAGPGPMVSVTATVTAAGVASASWNQVAGAINYFAIRWKPDEPGCCTSMSAPGPSAALSWQDGTLPKQGTYAYRVYATTTGGVTYTGETTFSWPQALATGMPRTGGTILNPNAPPPPPPPAPVSALPAATPTGTITPMPPPPPATVGTAPAGPGARTTGTVVPPSPPPVDQTTGLRVGTGISDITGPIAEVVMMGYAEGSQVANGLHSRLYARAFVFADQTDKRVVFVSADLAMSFSSVKQGVMRKLADRFGGRYDDRNVMISATHTHVGPGGYSHHTIYNISTGGHVKQNYDAIVAGIAEAIIKADSSLAPATVTLREGNIVERASVNRSVSAFTLNPEAAGASALPPENPAMTVLGIRRGNQPVGAISWFAVHNTSLTKGIRQVSGDHKGYAAYLMERKYGSIAPLRNYGGFVAAFPNGAEGDLSPNIGTPYGPPTAITFTGPAPSGNPFDHMKVIGDREYRTADELFNSVGQVPVTGGVDFRHAFVKMPGLQVASSFTNGLVQKTLCKAAYGVSFMAGTEDGRTGSLQEGLAHGTTMPVGGLEAARAAIVGIVIITLPALGPPIFNSFASPDAATDDLCHTPKPVLVPTGRLTDFTPEILPFQILRIGPVAIVGIPGEMTVTGGRRLQRRVMDVLAPSGVQRVILSGLSNEYSGYITTPEEYPSQQYEGASTLFGRLTLDGYIQEFGKLAVSLAAGPAGANQAQAASQEGPAPLDGVQRELQTGVVFDDVATGEFFGSVLVDAPAEVTRGEDVVKVRFRAGHPKNNLMRNDSYFRIERDTGGGNFSDLVAWDSTPDTWLFWSRDAAGPAVSHIEIHWAVPKDAETGTYRITHKGTWKSGQGNLADYSGVSRTFVVK